MTTSDPKQTPLFALCSQLEQQGASLKGVQLKEIFDKLLVEVRKPSTFPVDDSTLICDSLHGVKEEALTDVAVVSHELVSYLLTTLGDILRRWHKRTLLNEHESKLFGKLTVFLSDILASDGIGRVEMRFFSEKLIQTLIDCVHDVGVNGIHLTDPNLQHLAKLIMIISRLQHIRPAIADDYRLKKLLESVIQCLTSPFYGPQMHFTMFGHITQRYFASHKQFDAVDISSHNGAAFLLHACPEYFITYKGKRREQFSLQLVQTPNVDTIEEIFTRFVPFVALWDNDILTAVSHLMRILVNLSNVEASRTVLVQRLQLVDHLVHMLREPTLCAQMQQTTDHKHPVVQLLHATLTFLYNLTCDRNVLQHIKNKQHGTITFLSFTHNAQLGALQLQAYQLLAATMNETDIKNLKSKDKIVSVIVSYLEKAFNNSTQRYLGVHVYSLLSTLKALVVTDDIRDEVIKQKKGLTIVLKCVKRFGFGQLYLKPSLDILSTLVFNTEAARILREDNEFVSYLASPNEIVRRLASVIQNKLQEQSNPIIQPTEAADRVNFKYDIMMSYSHGDKELCFQIYDRLVADGFRVWLDREQMGGSVMAAMAEAIANSELVLLCMSHNYKQSAACQVEACYAYKRGRCIIPLMVQDRYKPDGWLGILTSGLLYVNFTKSDFDLAYRNLKGRIEELRQANKNQ